MNKKLLVFVIFFLLRIPIIYMLKIILIQKRKFMSYFILLLVSIFFILKTEKTKTSKKIYSSIYICLICITFLYNSGEVIGQFIYNITH